MEQSSRDWLQNEIEAAEILADLHNTFSLFSSVPYTWVRRKKRSAILNKPSSNGGATVVPPPSNAVKAKVSSPTTPLSFPATESDEKNKHSEKRTSLKRKKEHYLNIIEDLTKTKDSITQEIADVKRQCEKLKVFNSKLKAEENKLKINGPKGECKNPNLVINSPKKLNDIIKNSVNYENVGVQIAHHHSNNFGVNQTTSLAVASSSSLGRNSDDMGSLSIPDLNLSIEERAAEARQRRVHILRIKKHERNNSKQHQSSSR